MRSPGRLVTAPAGEREQSPLARIAAQREHQRECQHRQQPENTRVDRRERHDDDRRAEGG